MACCRCRLLYNHQSLRSRLEEEDYRGERYANHHKELKGNNDLLVITKPEVRKLGQHVYVCICSPIAVTDDRV
jgi:5-methyltetrahydrofolate--homocysteine methyltransferase